MNFRLIVAVCAAMLALPAGNAFAGQAEDVLIAVQKCATITDDKARLACYDGLAPRVRDAMARPPEPQEASHPPTEEEQKSWFGFDISDLFGSSPAQQTTPQKFGSENLPATHAQEEAAQARVESITAGVTDYAFTPFGRFVVFLDNGQVWRQLQGDSEHAMFEKNPKDNKVTIERGLLGSYNLLINDSSKVYKVTRVK